MKKKKKKKVISAETLSSLSSGRKVLTAARTDGNIQISEGLRYLKAPACLKLSFLRSSDHIFYFFKDPPPLFFFILKGKTMKFILQHDWLPVVCYAKQRTSKASQEYCTEFINKSKIASVSWAAPFDPWRQRHFQTKKSWLSVFRCYLVALDLNTCSFHVIGPFLLCICGHKLFNYRLIVCHQCQPVRKYSALPQEEVTPGEATALTSRSTEEQKQEPCVRLPGQPGVHLSGVLPVGQTLSICCGPIGHRVCGVFKEVRQWINTSSLKVVWLLCGTNIEMIVNFWADAGG